MIKARVWSKEINQFIEWEQLLESPDLVDHLKHQRADAYYSEMQLSTGLYDCNDNEMYQGDYVHVRLKDGEIEDFVIVWSSENARFMLVDKNGVKWGFTESNEFEVFGHAYEDDEIL